MFDGCCEITTCEARHVVHLVVSILFIFLLFVVVWILAVDGWWPLTRLLIQVTVLEVHKGKQFVTITKEVTPQLPCTVMQKEKKNTTHLHAAPAVRRFRSPICQSRTGNPTFNLLD